MGVVVHRFPWRSAPVSPGRRRAPGGPPGPGYKWVALSNTTLSIMMAMIDGSIVIIAMPAIFRGIGLDPFAPGNIAYLLWMIMGYLLVQAVLVVSLGRLGDMYGRVRIYNLGFVVFTAASMSLSFDPFTGGRGALWLIGWRVVQAVGGSMLIANSAAILTDAFPAHQRGMALGINQVAGISGQFIGLLLGGLLAAWDWRAVFWVNVPIGLAGTIWSYRSLREIAATHRARIDWAGNVTFAAGAGAILVAITYGIQPYGTSGTGWGNPWVLAGLAGGAALLGAFCVIETKVAEPMFRLGLFRVRAFAAGNAAALLGSIARGGLQFMLVIWLAGIWLPLHGYDFAVTPLWAGIYLLPLTAGFLIAGPASGYLSDKYGQRLFATAGLLVAAGAFTGLMLLPADFPYWAFALIILANGLGNGLFASPNTSAIMNSVPAPDRGVASGMRSTFQNSGMSLSIGIFFTLMITRLAATLPASMTAGLRGQGVPAAAAAQIAHLPPVSTLFAALLGYNPVRTLLAPTGLLARLPSHNVAVLTSRTFFPDLIAGPFHQGLITVFTAAAAMALIGALISALRGSQFYYGEEPAAQPAPRKPSTPHPHPRPRWHPHTPRTHFHYRGPLLPLWGNAVQLKLILGPVPRLYEMKWTFTTFWWCATRLRVCSGWWRCRGRCGVFEDGGDGGGGGVGDGQDDCGLAGVGLVDGLEVEGGGEPFAQVVGGGHDHAGRVG